MKRATSLSTVNSQFETLEFFTALFNEHEIATPVYGTWHGDPSNFAAMQDGKILSILAPDWYVGILKSQVPQMSGKWKAVGMPAWYPGGRRTTTRGGTMIGITKQCENPDLAWEVLKFTYFDRPGLVNRYETTRIIPPLKSAWDAPIFKRTRCLLGWAAARGVVYRNGTRYASALSESLLVGRRGSPQRCDFRSGH